jgi:hypothetical protein
MRIPGERRTIIVLGNINRLGRTVRDLADILRGERVAVPRARHLVPMDSARTARHAATYAGVYRTAAGDSVVVSLEGSALTASRPDEWRTPVLEEADGTFYLPVPNASARFTGQNGRELVLQDAFGGTMLRATRR